MTEDLQTQLTHDLVVESFENLDQFDRDLLAIEQNEATADTLNSMFRTIHTLKGTSGCLGLGRIEKLAHAGENLLSSMRDGRLTPHAEMITTLLAYADALRAMLGSLQDTGTEGNFDHSTLVADLQRLHEATAQTYDADSAVYGLFAEEEEAAPTVNAGVSKAPELAAVEGTGFQRSTADSAIRVDVVQLDNLMDLVGELVLARNQIVQLSALKESALTNATQRLNHITTKLQENVMKTRMQPIGNVWSRFPRIVRDVSHEVGKQVSLVMEGTETELDRTIIEAIKDPMTHLVRNAVDHGLETPEERVARGKSAQGTLRLRAFHQGGQVIIEITDDGAGVDRERVRRKALQKGLLSEEQAARLTDRDLFQLLFTPGFSTAEAVTNLSGRGVGMDVVKKNIEKIGGTVDVQSEIGAGTTIRLKIPLTLAIIPALIIGCAANRYAVPQASLIELVRIDSEQAVSSIEYIGSNPVYRLRGNLLPIVYLRSELEVKAEATADDATFLLVLQAEGRQFGLVVDSISDTEEIVVKPLGKELKSVQVYAGATIMGDGRVALILDVIGIARRSNVISETRTDALKAAERAEKKAGEEQADRQSLLLVSVGEADGEPQQIAVPLASVARLEEFPAKNVERAGRSEVVQYRGEIMPLIRVGQILEGRVQKAVDSDMIRVVVYLHRGQNVGLVVDRIIDTVEDRVRLQRCSNRSGILGSAVVQKRVTDFLDADALIEASGVVSFDLTGAAA